ncbi:Rhodanese-related sulfurtransferase [Paramaledivibacter caminithermalis DSM 15212]|uniref:Rhodanese-related sulfurtransferase n=2 Tax=Paramaledivibacter TaxID=1884934 RepID=A0A1M6MCK4_PARC5|nr:Rhodanese-related sulfurtransferase [Paramaledivibacter caminithermalis DSM 15212]
MEAIYESVEKYFKDLRNGCNNLIDCQQLKEKIVAGEKLFLLDIRKKEDYDKGHIEGAFHAEWPEVWDFIQEGVFRKDEKIIVICYTGQTAGQTVSILKILGYDACSLKGGMNNGWNKEDMPIQASCST